MPNPKIRLRVDPPSDPPRRAARIRLRPLRRNDCDVFVVGAGPAGAAAAANLARTGLRVIVADGQHFPRDKVCGDFVGPAGLVELARLGVSRRPEYRETNIIERAALFLDGERLISRPIPRLARLPPHGRVIPRAQLDHWILEAARVSGAHVKEGFRVTGFEYDAGGVDVHTKGSNGPRSFRCRVLVGADGSSSAIARQMRGQPTSRQDRIIAVRGYFSGVTCPSEEAGLYFSSESFPGYYWVFPTGSGGNANVGVGMVLDTLPRTQSHLRDLLVRLIDSDPALKKALQGSVLKGKIVGWPLTTYNSRQPVVADRILLLGDAAGLINPLNGEGIQYALLSARWATKTLSRCAKEDDFSRDSLDDYRQAIERELRYDMALARLIVQIISNRHLNPVWLQALRTIVGRACVDPDYADLVGGILAGLVPARKALNPRLIGGTVEQAVLSAVVASAGHVWQGPRHVAGGVASALGRGIGVAWATATHPLAFSRWGLGVADDGVELAGQVLQASLARVGRDAAGRSEA